MTRFAGVLLVVLALVSCDPPVVTPPPPANPPQVFLTVTEPNVMGDAVRGKVNVSGCKKVAGVEILHQDTRLLTIDYTKSPTDFTLPAGTFSALYGQLGIAAALNLKAKVTCDDARTNTSTPVGVSFFPVARRFTAMDGSQIVPDQFIAEGGLGGTPNTFLGCARTDTGTTILRVDTAGTLLAYVASMPFDCTLGTQISDLSTVSGYRWVFEPKVGAFALDMRTFNVGKKLLNNRMERIGVGKNGTAVVWINEPGTPNRIQKLAPSATDTTNDWQAPFDTIMNSNPLVVDDGANKAVWVTRWEFNVGSRKAAIVPYKHDFFTGAVTNGVVNGVPAVLLSQQYPLSDVSEPIIPEGVFGINGDTFTIAAFSYDTSNNIRTTVLSCATAFGLCEGAARRWTSPIFTGTLRAVVPFSNNNIYAVLGPFQVIFLTAQLGTVMNLGELPITPSGSLQVLGVQPGGGSDFYILTGPDLGPGIAPFATEIIALDTPQSGELWRIGYGSGESPGNAMHIGIDEAQQVWLRVGSDLIKPLPNNEYRTARGPTRVP